MYVSISTSEQNISLCTFLTKLSENMETRSENNLENGYFY